MVVCVWWVAGHFPDDAEVRVTQDIDALYWPKAEVEVVAREIAAERGLPSGWLNDNARPWSPRGDDRRPTNSFQISFADLDELVAMKLAGSREQDLKDLEILSRQMGIQHPEQLVRIAYEQYGEDSVALNESREDYLEIARQVLARAKKHRRR